MATHSKRPGAKLGKVQQGVLDALKRHGKYPGGWVWENHSTTVRVLESLVKRGLVEKTERDAQTRTVATYKLAPTKRAFRLGDVPHLVLRRSFNSDESFNAEVERLLSLGAVEEEYPV